MNSTLPTFPGISTLIVIFGTLAEFALPLMIILGLFTRIAAIGMSIFVLVQSYVDIYVHKVDAGTIGALFDRDSASLVYGPASALAFPLCCI